MYGSFFNVEVDGKLKKNKSLTDIFAWKDNPSLRIVTSKKRLTFEELMAIPEIQRAGGAIRKGTPAAFRNLAPRACNPQTAGRLGTEDGQEEEQGAVGGGLPVISMVSYDVMDELSERAAQKAAQLQEERSKVEGGPASLQRELDMAERGRCIPLQEGGDGQAIAPQGGQLGVGGPTGGCDVTLQDRNVGAGGVNKDVCRKLFDMTGQPDDSSTPHHPNPSILLLENERAQGQLVQANPPQMEQPQRNEFRNATRSTVQEVPRSVEGAGCLGGTRNNVGQGELNQNQQVEGSVQRYMPNNCDQDEDNHQV